MSSKPHEARSLPLSERVDYLMIVASMAGVDVVLEPTETKRLRELCGELDLPEEETKAILMASHRPTATIERHLEGLRGSPLRFVLLSDCVSLAFADGEYGKDEQHEVKALATALEVTSEQLDAIEECVRAVRAAAEAKGEVDHQKAGAVLAARLASVGIPVGVVAGVSAFSLEMAGVSSGLAALGMGLGIATGFGAAIGLGVGTYVGVRWLKGKLGGEPA